MPQLQGYDPFAKVKSIEESGQKISDILVEARVAEQQLQRQRMAQKGAMVLHDIIDKRASSYQDPESRATIGFAPFLDPEVNRAAAMISPLAPDYVNMLKGISDQNAKYLQPKFDAHGNEIKFNPAIGKFQTTHTEPIDVRSAQEQSGDRISHFEVGIGKETGKEYWKTKTGETEKQFSGSGGASIVKSRADSKRKLAESQKIITDFESNPKMVQSYKAIVNDKEVQDAVSSGNIDLATAVISRLIGDTTPQKVMTKRMFDYIRAVSDEEGEMAYLKELGVDTSKLQRKQPDTESDDYEYIRGQGLVKKK